MTGRDRGRSARRAAVAVTLLVFGALAAPADRLTPQEPASALREPASAVQDSASLPREIHPAAREAISKIRSPYCPGLMLEVCPSLEAQWLRDSIQAGALEGLSADSLLEMVILAHGEEYRAFPKNSGAGLLAWVIPPLALLLGLGLVLVALRKLRGPVGEDVEAGEMTERERGLLDAALAELEEMEDTAS
ncbi:MAG: cytochrome c-type biogenesis protein CcmH [Gemmatimonadetes bacterium]|nr:cytochrome c-type biogenesis protein CcmH [Gemmatimonadota bacterium]